MNKEAGRGGGIIVTFRLEDGQQIPLAVDTGSPWTLLDKSLKPTLGKRLGSTRVWYVQGNRIKRLNRYVAPKLYLGTLLLTTSSDRVLTDDFNKGSQSADSPKGILGLDVLRRYRIQLDFETGKFRLLGANDPDAAELGKTFPLAYSGGHALINRGGLIGSKTNIIIDTGCNIDGLVNKGAIKGMAVILPQCIWDGECYTGLVVAAPDHVNVLGLSFLARHLVTLDFPNRVMYLKQITSGPLAGNVFNEIGAAHRAPAEFLEQLKEKGQLPGVKKEEQTTIYYMSSDRVFKPYGLIFGRWELRKSLTFDFYKNGDSSTFHYQVVRTSANNSWKLQKAWRTDQNGCLIAQYPIPSA